jgi:hypothetical protein
LNEYSIIPGRIFLENKARIASEEGISEEQIDEALAIVYRVLRTNPHGFKLIGQHPPLAGFRKATRHLYMGDGFIVPPLELMFMIHERDRVVRILGMKKQSGFGDLDF